MLSKHILLITSTVMVMCQIQRYVTLLLFHHWTLSRGTMKSKTFVYFFLLYNIIIQNNIIKYVLI